MNPNYSRTVLFCVLLVGCAESIPKGKYGVASLELQGVEVMDEAALKTCLATRERDEAGFTLAYTDEPVCGVPPFDAGRTEVDLFAWPWTEWPLYDARIFRRDLSRVTRWYQARGYYDATVTAVERKRDEEDREIDIAITVSEGEPVIVKRIDIRGLEALDGAVRQQAQAAIKLWVGAPFDEALYDRSKRALTRALREASYAKVTVEGRVELDPQTREAVVVFTAVPGPACVFGTVIVRGNEDLGARQISEAADIDRGQPFSVSALKDAERAIYGLGPIASVEAKQLISPGENVIDVILEVVPGRTTRFGVGIGMESGGIHSQQESESTGDSFAQWDVHLLAKAEHRNFLGGYRKLRIEDRPRLIFDDPFPQTQDLSPGNLLLLEFKQPAFGEPRTTLVARARWDRGPDPFGGKFLRHDVVTGVGPQRLFFGGRVFASSTLNLNLFLPDNEDPFPNYNVMYMQHRVTLDLRDNPRNTRKGSFFGLTVQHAGHFLPSDWDYVRVTPEARGYAGLPLGIVLAGRARLGWMEVTDSDIAVPEQPDALDPDAAQRRTAIRFVQNLRDFGPVRNRLRGGGHNSVRGYAPNTLGDAELVDDGRVRRLISGGLRQWEASLELRIPITVSFGTVLFVDAGDVSRNDAWRFDHPQTTIGVGLRYRTIVGPLRLDAGFAPQSLQVLGDDERIRDGLPQSRMLGLSDGAIHFTIGEAF